MAPINPLLATLSLALTPLASSFRLPFSLPHHCANALSSTTPHGGDITHQFPGCTLILNSSGKIKLEQGPACRSSCSPIDPSDYAWDEAVIQSPRCLTILRQGTISSQQGTDCPSTMTPESGQGKSKGQSDKKDKYKNCQIVHPPTGEKIIQCPGCQLIIGPDGKDRVRQGPDCDKYEDEKLGNGKGKKERDGNGHGNDDDDGPRCTYVRSWRNDVLQVCPGCTRIVDADGDELLKTGNRCDEYETGIGGDDGKHGLEESEKESMHIMDEGAQRPLG